MFAVNVLDVGQMRTGASLDSFHPWWGALQSDAEKLPCLTEVRLESMLFTGRAVKVHQYPGAELSFLTPQVVRSLLHLVDQDRGAQVPGEIIRDVDAKESESWCMLHHRSIDTDGGRCGWVACKQPSIRFYFTALHATQMKCYSGHLQV